MGISVSDSTAQEVTINTLSIPRWFQKLLLQIESDWAISTTYHGEFNTVPFQPYVQQTMFSWVSFSSCRRFLLQAFAVCHPLACCFSSSSVAARPHSLALLATRGTQLLAGQKTTRARPRVRAPARRFCRGETMLPKNKAFGVRQGSCRVRRPKFWTKRSGVG